MKIKILQNYFQCIFAFLVVASSTYAAELPDRTNPVQNREPLLQKEFLKLPLGQVKARGWLLTQLELQRDGLTGNAEELYFWLRLPSCGWLGGEGEDSWEKAPYYVKGLIALAYTLDDDDLKKKVTKWVDWALESQTEDGWFGPAINEDWWPRMVVLYYLRDYYEATGDQRVIPFLKKYFAYQLKHLPERPLYDWGKARGGDNLDIVLWLYNISGDQALLDLAEIIKSQTNNWATYYGSGTAIDWFSNHIVNYNQGIKAPLLFYQMSRNPLERDSFLKATESGWAVERYGRVDGMLSGTEPLSDDSSTAGTELCAVVERILSSGYALELGMVEAGDQMERVAFNALPADLSPDIKGLRYYALPNQVHSIRGATGFVNAHDNGIVPGAHSGFWCCNNNFHFGWPKFTQQLWMATADQGLAAMAYSPSEVTVTVGSDQTKVTMLEETDYPFRDTIKLTLSTQRPVEFPLKLRIPHWCSNPTIRINDVTQSGIQPNSFHVLDRQWNNGDTVELTFPMTLKTTRWIQDSVSVERGPLVYALAPKSSTTTVNDFGKGFKENEIRPTSSWNYALELDPTDPASTITVQTRPMPKQPFSPSEAPVILNVPARQVEDWKVRAAAVRADEVPQSPVFTDRPQETITLVPYGSTEIRVTYFPLYSSDGNPYSLSLYQSAVASASHTWHTDSPAAMNDGIEPTDSGMESTPRYTCWDHTGTNEWVQYEWPEAKSFAGVEVYWFQDQAGCRVPASWELQYWDVKDWKSVGNPSQFGTAKDQFNRVAFDPVKTTKLRINFQCQAGFATGILEWRVNESQDEFPTIAQNDSSGNQPLRLIPFEKVEMTDELWRPLTSRLASKTLPHAFTQTTVAQARLRKCAEWLESGGITVKPEPHRFNTSDLYKVMEGAAMMLQAEPNPEIELQMDRIIAIIARAQRLDGYLYIPHIVGNPVPEEMGERPYSFILHSHELYNVGHLYEAAVAYARATGKTKLLGVAEKNAQHVNKVIFEGGDPNYNDGKPVLQAPGHQEIEIALAKLYNYTGNALYLDMAKKFLDIRGVTYVPTGTHGTMSPEYAQQQAPVSKQKEAVGHAVRATYMYAAMAEIDSLTGKQDYTEALDAIWHNIVDRKMHISGGLGAVRHIEGFGPDFILPNKDTYLETCAAVGNVFFNMRMFLKSTDATYVDVAEVALYNNSLAGIGVDGRSFFYPNPLEADAGHRPRAGWFGTACCPSNIARLVPQVPGYMYAQQGDEIYCLLYGACSTKIEVAGTELGLIQETGYPFQGTIRFEVTPAKPVDFSLNLRIPTWAREQFVPGKLYHYSEPPSGWTVKVNGQPVETQLEKGYVQLNRNWQAGDVVELNLPMPVQVNTCIEEVEANRGRVSFTRGPILFSAEGIDNGGKVQRFFVDPVHAQAGARVTHIDEGVLAGLPMLKLPAKALTAERKIEAEVLKLVPYYAWSNRGRHSMNTWFGTNKELAENPTETQANFASVTASHTFEQDWDGAIILDHTPSSSQDDSIRRWTSWPQTNRNQWVEIELTKSKTLRSIGVYWYNDNGGVKLPANWHIEVPTIGGWERMEIYNTDSYSTLGDAYNTVQPASETRVDKFRIIMQPQSDSCVGILSVNVNAQ